MSEKVDQFCDNLRGRLNTIEGRLKSLKTNIEAVPNQTEKAVHDKLDEARRKLHSQRGHIDQTRAKFNAWVEEKVTETEEAVSHWMGKRETHKLNNRADRAEAYAAAAMDLAAAAIDDAEEAILDAAMARFNANATQPSATARL